MRDCKDKVLHDQYLRQTKEVKSEQSWVWLQNGDLKRETESLIVAGQNQSIRTNCDIAKTDESQKDTLCRLCKKADKSIDYVVSGCRYRLTNMVYTIDSVWCLLIILKPILTLEYSCNIYD